MKRTGILAIFAWALLAALPLVSHAQASLAYTDATKLTLTGKAWTTQEPYYRVDVDKYPELTNGERNLLTYPTGIAVAFRTDSPTIGVMASYRVRTVRTNQPEMTTAGFDLYIKRGGEWIFAGCNVPPQEAGKPAILVDNMEEGEKECLMYLPIYSELETVEIGVAEGSRIAPMENPFRSRIVFFGSSFTHGTSTARSGMSYPVQIGRRTGLGVINLGVAGSSKLQPVFAEMLGNMDVDAYVFDAFSNPTAEMIRERFDDFVAALRKAQPGKPLIFLQTIYRENGNFNLKTRGIEEAKRAMARQVVAEAMKTDPDIYFVDVPNPTGTDHETSADGVHPSDLGYFRWAQAVEPEITKILSRYGIK